MCEWECVSVWEGKGNKIVCKAVAHSQKIGETLQKRICICAWRDSLSRGETLMPHENGVCVCVCECVCCSKLTFVVSFWLNVNEVRTSARSKLQSSYWEKEKVGLSMKRQRKAKEQQQKQQQQITTQKNYRNITAGQREHQEQESRRT